MQFKFLAIVTPLVLALVFGSCGKSKKYNLDDDDDDSEEMSHKSTSSFDSIIIDDENDNISLDDVVERENAYDTEERLKNLPETDEPEVIEVVEEVQTRQRSSPTPPLPSQKSQGEEVFKSAAHMPSFPGGDAALVSFVNKNLRYPSTAKANGVQGKVIVQFVVEKDGSVGEVKVARSCDKDLDKEAVRVCKMLPKFTPGSNANGDPVRVWYTFPVQFKLN